MIVKSKQKILLAFPLAIFILFLSACSNTNNVLKQPLSEAEKIKIATCPTCFAMTQKLDSEKYQLIPTTSTAQSIALLQSGQVDLILAGRTLKPEEPILDSLIIKEGYSFLAKEEIIIYSSDLANYQIYTDLDVASLKTSLEIENIEPVDDVYQYLNQGIIITSWENTDYHRANLAHILENNGKRVNLSRRPTVYCAQACDQKAQDIATLLK
ncbi:MAG: hypothetical protein PHO91_03400 [Patescibacteria group bacterium]|nr:hypothetical protein [Patescibacteria group bacterium]